MAWEMREGGGSLFRNEKENDKQPDYRGEIMLDGKVYKLAGWIKDGKSGKFLSLKGQPKEAGAPAMQDSGTVGDMADDVPF